MPYDPDLDAVFAKLADLESLRSRLGSAESKLLTTQQELASTNSQVHQLTNEVTTLKAEVADLKQGGIVIPPAATFPGDPGKGFIRWGSSIGGNADPVARHESIAGVPMGVRRTFYDMSKVTSLVNTCSADIAAGRIPWVSVKLGATWRNVAAGTIDTALDAMFKRLALLPGPIWFTAHHEPEGGNGTPYPDDGQGTEPDWRNMQVRVRRVLDASGAKNIAFAPILMSWTWDTRSGRNPLNYWVPDIWDFAGIDHYKDNTSTTPLAEMAGWKECLKFYTARNLRIGVGEWGNRSTGTLGVQQMQAFYDHLLSIDSPGCAYFDSALNTTNGSWELTGDPLVKFRDLMKVATSKRGK